MGDVFLQQRPQVPLIHDDKVVQALAPERADHALRDGVRLRRLHRNQDRLNPDGPGPPHEVTAVCAIAVAKQVPRLLPPRGGFEQLTPDPARSRTGRHGDVHDTAARVRDEKQDVQGFESQCLHGEEVSGPQLRAVIGEEGSPGRRRWTPQGPPSVASHRLRADVVAEGEQFALDAKRAPPRIFGRDAPNEVP